MNAQQIKVIHMREQFVKFYLMGNSIKESATMAGYSPKTAGTQGSLLLQMPEIQKMVEEERSKIAEKMEIKKEDLVKDLIEIKNRTKYKNPTIAIKCVEVINKMYGYNSDEKSTVTVKQDPGLFGPLTEINEFRKNDN
jgi:phage terminase small subunit